MKIAQPIEYKSHTYNRLLANLPLREQLIWQLGVDTGLRVSDIISLRVKGLRQKMTVTEQKTGNKRTIKIQEGLIERLFDFARRTPDSPWVFASPHDHSRHISRHAVARHIRLVSRGLGIDGIVSVHSSRKIYAINLLRETGDARAVQADLGHAQLATTLLYIHGAPPAR